MDDNSGNNVNHLCHDCGKILGTDEQVHEYRKKNGRNPAEDDLIIAYKCHACYENDPVYRRKCEVFSRVTGYLRPVSQWNKGKRQEFKERKRYKIREEVMV